MGAGRRDYDARAWIVWLVMLAGPVVLGSYYVVALLRGNAGAS